MSCFGPKLKKKNLIFFGLEDSGKTSLLYRLKYDKLIYTEPTVGYNIEPIFEDFNRKYKLKLTCLDLPGTKSLRLIWKQFLDETVDGLVYVIDLDMFLESGKYVENCRKLLWETLDDNELLDTCPLLIYLNKIDLCDGKIMESQKIIDLNSCGNGMGNPQAPSDSNKNNIDQNQSQNRVGKENLEEGENCFSENDQEKNDFQQQKLKWQKSSQVQIIKEIYYSLGVNQLKNRSYQLELGLRGFA